MCHKGETMYSKRLHTVVYGLCAVGTENTLGKSANLQPIYQNNEAL